MKTIDMTEIIISDLPEPVYRKLQQRAQRNRQTLEQYLLAELTEMTEKLTMDEWLERAAALRARQRADNGGRPIGGPDSVELIRQGRAERDANIARALGYERGEDGAYRRPGL